SSLSLRRASWSRVDRPPSRTIDFQVSRFGQVCARRNPVLDVNCRPHRLFHYQSWFTSLYRSMSRRMNFTTSIYNSESMSAGVWNNGIGVQGINGWTDRYAGFSNENYQWLLRSDPLLASYSFEPSFDWPELGPREEALALADHSQYCRKAEEIMDPYYDPHDSLDYSQYIISDDVCPNEMPSTSSAPPSNGPPAIDQSHMDWLETFGPINNYDVMPSDLDDAANNVDWDSWMKYLDDDEQNAIQSNQAPQLVVKQEEDQYIPQCNAVPKQESSPPVYNNFPVTVKEEVEDIKPFIGRSFTPRVPSRFSPYDDVKPKRGRPKKIRVPEDQEKMSLNDRRKAMNRDAALRYRERKKVELDQLKFEGDELEVRNQILREQEEQLKHQIRMMKIQLNQKFDFKFDFMSVEA
ncbi:hypothetical protein PFISCL1PPCAC_2680, partial [Pristionchus fissidentatus]